MFNLHIRAFGYVQVKRHITRFADCKLDFGIRSIKHKHGFAASFGKLDCAHTIGYDVVGKLRRRSIYTRNSKMELVIVGGTVSDFRGHISQRPRFKAIHIFCIISCGYGTDIVNPIACAISNPRLNVKESTLRFTVRYPSFINRSRQIIALKCIRRSGIELTARLTGVTRFVRRKVRLVKVIIHNTAYRGCCAFGKLQVKRHILHGRVFEELRHIHKFHHNTHVALVVIFRRCLQHFTAVPFYDSKACSAAIFEIRRYFRHRIEGDNVVVFCRQCNVRSNRPSFARYEGVTLFVNPTNKFLINLCARCREKRITFAVNNFLRYAFYTATFGIISNFIAICSIYGIYRYTIDGKLVRFPSARIPFFARYCRSFKFRIFHRIGNFANRYAFRNERCRVFDCSIYGIYRYAADGKFVRAPSTRIPFFVRYCRSFKFRICYRIGRRTNRHAIRKERCRVFDCGIYGIYRYAADGKFIFFPNTRIAAFRRHCRRIHFHIFYGIGYCTSRHAVRHERCRIFNCGPFREASNKRYVPRYSRFEIVSGIRTLHEPTVKYIVVSIFAFATCRIGRLFRLFPFLYLLRRYVRTFKGNGVLRPYDFARFGSFRACFTRIGKL